jgi:hypothetical protein
VLPLKGSLDHEQATDIVIDRFKAFYLGAEYKHEDPPNRDDLPDWLPCGGIGNVRCYGQSDNPKELA